MKRLFLLFAISCVGLASCSDSATLDVNDPDGLKKRFDFSEVDTDNIQSIREENNFNIPDVTVLTGVLNDCLWVGLFDTESGSLKCQYTDEDHPISYFAYGEEYKYGIGQVLDAYFDNNKLLIVIKYAYPGYAYSFRIDFISITGDGQYRNIIDEKFTPESVERAKLSSNIICILLGEDTLFEFGDTITFMYDVSNDSIVCSIREKRSFNDYRLGCNIFYKIEYDNKGLPYNPYNIFLSPENPLHIWSIILQARSTIIECECTSNTVTTTEQYKNIFDYNPSDCRYSYEYTTRTYDHVAAVITQTEYDGTITTKTVDIRVENDELKVEIQ